MINALIDDRSSWEINLSVPFELLDAGHFQIAKWWVNLACNSTSDEEKSRIDPILDVLGGLDGLNERIVTPLVFENRRIRIGAPTK